jgi:hypothetical protein
MSRAVWLESGRLVTLSSNVRVKLLVFTRIMSSRHFEEDECRRVSSRVCDVFGKMPNYCRCRMSIG